MNTEFAPQNAWEDYVGKAINDLKQRHPTLNLSQIAMKINLNRSTLTRIINEGIKPQLDNYIKIIVGSGNGDLINTALTAYDDSFLKSESDFEKINLHELRRTETTPDLEKILEIAENYVAYMLSLKEYGSTIDEVNHVLGSRGSTALDELLKFNLIEIEGDKVRSIKKNHVIYSSRESAKNRLKFFSQFYKLEHCQKERNYLKIITEGMNKEGILKMQNLHAKFHQDMREIVSAKENQGDIPMFSVAFTDSFTSINYNSKQELI